MSADNGHVIRRNKDGKYVLQTYFASAEEYPPIEGVHPSQIFNTLEDALSHYDALKDDALEYGCALDEYGLMVDVDAAEKTKGEVTMREDKPSKPTANELIRDYGRVLREIYDNRTAGDYTFVGVLSAFLNDFAETGD